MQSISSSISISKTSTDDQISHHIETSQLICTRVSMLETFGLNGWNFIFVSSHEDYFERAMLTFSCSKSTTKTLEKGVKYV